MATTAPDPTNHVIRLQAPSRFFARAWFDAFARRFPLLALVVVTLVSNAGGSVFNFLYNWQLIVERHFSPAQKAVFWDVAGPVYNLIAYPFCFVLLFYLLWPTMRCLRQLRRGVPVSPLSCNQGREAGGEGLWDSAKTGASPLTPDPSPPEYRERGETEGAIDPKDLESARRRLVNFPFIQLLLNPIAWLPGAIFFPWIVCSQGGSDNADIIWPQFGVSFVISTVFTTVQTFFVIQSFLTAYLYPDFFKDSRPESVPGTISIPFTARLVMLWFAVAFVPLFAFLAVALNFVGDNKNEEVLYWLGPSLVAVSAVSGGGIFWLVGRDLRRWIDLQTQATSEIARGNYEIRIDHPRPDEWGKLTNRFNDMAIALSQAWESHETLGQLVSPEVRDQILKRMHGFEVQVQEITVLFVDIRGFTTRCAGESPKRIGTLLNRFLTLALCSVEEKGGYVNKFLGDGVMALFGATHPQSDHADLAIASAREMLLRLHRLNAELTEQGHAPLVIGIGIHTGDALVGCFGAVLQGDNGQPVMRREFSAIGETVNLCQRIEQLTKKCGGPILISECTRLRLQRECVLECVGPQELPGSPTPLIIHKLNHGDHGEMQ